VVFLILLVLLGSSPLAAAEEVFRNPVAFMKKKKLVDVRLGPGYNAYENFRRHGREVTGTQSGPTALYDLRLGPVNITNIFDQAGFTKGKGPRVGLLFTYTGDTYDATGIAKRDKSLFGGGFLGYGYLTFYGYSDLLGRKAGVIYAARFAPLLFNIGTSEFFLVMELEHMNRLYVDYYFGIRRYEANSLLSAYDGRASNNVSATLLYVWNISKAVQFTLWGGEKRYGVGVASSPTVGLKHAYRTGVGFLFRLF